MKPIVAIIITMILFCDLTAAQDTLYIYKAGSIVTKRAVADIDSVIFYQPTINPPAGTATDIDGNIYNTVAIGNQVWMVENLKTTKYRNGEAIPNVTNNAAWGALTTGAYCWYLNDAVVNKVVYGALYNWFTVVDSRNIAPIGWHVPSDAEWTILTTYLGGENSAGSKMKETGTTHWSSPNSDATNVSGFTALPGGYRYGNNTGTFSNIGYGGTYWSITPGDNSGALDRSMGYDFPNCYRFNNNNHDGFSVRCVKDDNSTSFVIPTLGTAEASSITTTSATSGGNITNDGGATVTERGVCWNTTGSPTTTNSKTADGAGNGSFTSNLTNLTANTQYYVRAYATNSVGTAYGPEVSFKTQQVAEGTVTDIDGNVYHTITIGTQTWMVENLKTTKYRNGEAIPNVTDNTAWVYLYTGAYCNLNHDANNAITLGRLYNWYAVNDSRNIAPAGWHVPTDTEWIMLTTYLTNNGFGYGGSGSDIAKSIAFTSGWDTTYVADVGTPGNDQISNNSSGFSGLPGGQRWNSTTLLFYYIGTSGLWWSSSENDFYEAWLHYLYFNNSGVYRWKSDKHYGYSVRCIKDQITL